MKNLIFAFLFTFMWGLAHAEPPSDEVLDALRNGHTVHAQMRVKDPKKEEPVTVDILNTFGIASLKDLDDATLEKIKEYQTEYEEPLRIYLLESELATNRKVRQFEEAAEKIESHGIHLGRYTVPDELNEQVKRTRQELKASLKDHLRHVAKKPRASDWTLGVTLAGAVGGVLAASNGFAYAGSSEISPLLLSSIVMYHTTSLLLHTAFIDFFDTSFSKKWSSEYLYAKNKKITEQMWRGLWTFITINLAEFISAPLDGGYSLVDAGVMTGILVLGQNVFANIRNRVFAGSRITKRWVNFYVTMFMSGLMGLHYTGITPKVPIEVESIGLSLGSVDAAFGGILAGYLGASALLTASPKARLKAAHIAQRSENAFSEWSETVFNKLKNTAARFKDKFRFSRRPAMAAGPDGSAMSCTRLF